ncbi:MAG: D-alanyl-D-alanine carboxypeptidase family protein [Christensenellales bacterium]
MRRVFLILLVVLMVFSANALAALTGEPMVGELPVDIKGVSAILVELDSGQIIFEHNADEMRPVASVIKVMTILIALEALDNERATLEDVVTISPRSSGMGGSQILLDTGESQTYSQLLKSVIVASANDASVAIAEHLYGSEELFVSYMNERAEELGLTGTHFVNCTGLPVEGQHTTARDVAIASMAMYRHPLYYEYSTVWLEDFDHFDGRITHLTNTNKLIRLYEGCDGGKTGSTREAGYCMSATARRSGMRLISVVLGSQTSSDRFDTVSRMFDYGFANYRLYPVAEKGTPIRGELAVAGGDQKTVRLVLDGDLTLLIVKGGEQNVELIPNIPESLNAPVDVGERVGSVDVRLDGRIVGSLPVVAAESVTATGLKHVLGRILALWPL